MASSPLLDKVNTFLRIFTTLDPSPLLSICHPDQYQHSFAPRSLSPPAPFSLPEFFNHVAGLEKMLKSFPVQTIDQFGMSPDSGDSGRDITVWARSRVEWRPEAINASSTDGADGVEENWSWEGEYMFVFSFERGVDAEQARIVRCVEFLDSKSTERMKGLMEKAMANVVAKEGGENSAVWSQR